MEYLAGRKSCCETGGVQRVRAKEVEITFSMRFYQSLLGSSRSSMELYDFTFPIRDFYLKPPGGA